MAHDSRSARPRENLSNRTLRLLTLIGLLPRHPKTLTCSQLHRLLEQSGHVVDKRSVERDLNLLLHSREFGDLVHCDDRSQPYGWSLMANRHYLLTALDTSTALAWDLFGRYARRLLPPASYSRIEPLIRSAQAWLSDHQPGSEPWSQRVAYIPRGLALHPAPIHPAVQEAVYNATFMRQQVEVVYGPQQRTHVLHPRAIIDRGPVTYVVASCGDYTDFRLYALHRIHQARMLDTPINNLPFRLQDYLDQGVLELPHGQNIRLVLRFYNGAGDHLKETPLHPEQIVRELSEQCLELHAELQDTEELRWWILGLGDNVEVMAPVALRQDISAALHQAAARYRTSRNSTVR